MNINHHQQHQHHQHHQQHQQLSITTTYQQEKAKES
jgi:hypothetical protein